MILGFRHGSKCVPPPAPLWGGNPRRRCLRGAGRTEESARPKVPCSRKRGGQQQSGCNASEEGENFHCKSFLLPDLAIIRVVRRTFEEVDFVIPRSCYFNVAVRRPS